MCYAKPGPRCSAHAKKELDRARTEREEAHAIAGDKALRESYWADKAAEKERYTQETGGEWTYEVDKQYYQQHSYGKVMERSIEALDALNAAEAAYDATPAGMAELKATMAQRQEAVGDDVLTDSDYQIAKTRLARGQQTRRDQLEAHQQVLVLTGKAAAAPPSTDGHVVEDEDAALAPPPPCTCIEYRYQSDCSHLSARVEAARKTLLPTSTEASLRLHSAVAQERALREKWNAVRATHGLADTTDGKTYQAALDSSPELEAADKALRDAMREKHEAETAFYATPAGRMVLQERIAERMACVDGGPHYSGGWEGFQRDASKHTASMRESFTRRTGQPAPPIDTEVGAPPELMYASGCDHKCRDFAWTGRCPHTDPAWGRMQAISDAMAASPEMKRLSKALDKAADRATAPKKPSLVGRLLGRR